jgi:hypothetical protein
MFETMPGGAGRYSYDIIASGICAVSSDFISTLFKTTTQQQQDPHHGSQLDSKRTKTTSFFFNRLHT